MAPACVTACPTDAMEFGDRDELIEKAWARINAAPEGKYVKHVYGEKEVGGTAWMYISPVEMTELDFPWLSEEPVTKNARTAMGLLPYYATGMLALMAGIYFITKRKQKIAAGKHEEKKDSAMKEMIEPKAKFPWGTLILSALAFLCAGVLVQRYVFGLGAMTNMSDGRGWDCGSALTCTAAWPWLPADSHWRP